MKNIIVAIALMILMTTFSVYQKDNDLFLRMQEDLKYQADDLAAAAVLFYEPDAYGEGIKIFDYARANQQVADLLLKNLKVKNLEVSAGYWKGNQITCYIYYFDDSGNYHTYKNGHLQSEGTFTYGDMFREPLTGYNKLITKPTAVATIAAGEPKYRLSFLDPPPVIQTSAYEYKPQD